MGISIFGNENISLPLVCTSQRFWMGASCAIDELIPKTRFIHRGFVSPLITTICIIF